MIDPTQQPQQDLAQPVATSPVGQGAMAAPASDVPTAGTGSPLATMPAGLAQLPRQPSIPPMSLPHITPQTPNEDLPQEPRLDNLKNRFERRGLLLAQEVEAQGKRIADAMDQPPTGAVKLSPGQIKEYWRYSPVASTEHEANQRFWEVHDQALQQTGDPAQAEQVAMQKVFPYRAALVQVGVSAPDRQVEMAEHIRGVVDGDKKPDSGVVSHAHHAHVQEVTGGY